MMGERERILKNRNTEHAPETPRPARQPIKRVLIKAKNWMSDALHRWAKP